MQQYSV